MSFKFRFMSSSSATFRTLIASALIIIFFIEVFAEVCVWRDPERTMKLVFPNAKDYKTHDRKISSEKRSAIEKRLGKPLDPGERENWTYYEIVSDKGGTLGYIIADAEKGEYGVIEIVMGITPDGKVKQVYIQRARERDKTFKSKEFLEKFVGKTKDDPIQLGKDIKAENSTATEQVAFGVKKMLEMFDKLH